MRPESQVTRKVNYKNIHNINGGRGEENIGNETRSDFCSLVMAYSCGRSGAVLELFHNKYIGFGKQGGTTLLEEKKCKPS